MNSINNFDATPRVVDHTAVRDGAIATAAFSAMITVVAIAVIAGLNAMNQHLHEIRSNLEWWQSYTRNNYSVAIGRVAARSAAWTVIAAASGTVTAAALITAAYAHRQAEQLSGYSTAKNDEDDTLLPA